MKWLILVLVSFMLVGCHKKPVKAFVEPLHFSETINYDCIDHIEVQRGYCRKPLGSDVATCSLVKPVKKNTEECQKANNVFPD